MTENIGSESTSPPWKGRMAFGVAIGVAIGLLLVSVLVVVSGSLAFLIMGIPIHVIVVGTMLFMGIRSAREKWFPPVAWWVPVAVVIVGWPLCIWGPVKIRTLQIDSIAAREIPIYPGAKEVEISTQVLQLDWPFYITVNFFAESFDEVLQFYRDELGRRGWREDPYREALKEYPFRRSGHGISIWHTEYDLKRSGPAVKLEGVVAVRVGWY